MKEAVEEREYDIYNIPNIISPSGKVSTLAKPVKMKKDRVSERMAAPVPVGIFKGKDLGKIWERTKRPAEEFFKKRFESTPGVF